MSVKWIYPASALLLSLLVGYGHGRLTDRWGMPADVEQAAGLLKNTPLTVGDWNGQDGPEMTDRARVVAGAVGYIGRHYVHQRSGAVVSVTILCGRPGPISSHAPNVCFVQGGTEQLAEQVVHDLTLPDGTQAEFFRATFRPPLSAPGPDVETFWACSADGKQWDAVSDGRLVYAGAPHLYRIFATTPESVAQQRDGTEILDDFLKEFLPAVAETLAPAHE